MLKSIAKERVTESGLGLGKLKIDYSKTPRKNVVKTVQYLKRRITEEELNDKSMLFNAIVELLGYKEENIADIKPMQINSLSLGRSIAYDNYLEFKNLEKEDAMVYLDMNGKLPKAKNGNAYIWREGIATAKGSFKVYDGKKLLATYKLFRELKEEIYTTYKDGIDYENMGQLFKELFFIDRKYFGSVMFEAFTLDKILDIYQDDIDIKLMNDYKKAQSGDYAKAFMTKKNINKSIMERMETTQFKNNGFDFVEFDNDTDLDKLEQVESEWENIYQSLPKVNKKGFDLRFRKLGKHKANGVYFPTERCLSVDIRSVSSMMHEYGHLLDFELMDSEVSLSEDFRHIVRAYSMNVEKLDKDSYVHKKRSYYSTPTEVFARGFELYMKDKIETSFLKTEEEYNTLDEYTCFDSDTREGVKSFFKELFEQSNTNVA